MERDLAAMAIDTQIPGRDGITKCARAEMAVAGEGMGSVDTIPKTTKCARAGMAVDGGGMGSVDKIRKTKVPKTKIRKISPEDLEAYMEQARDAVVALARFEALMAARAEKASASGVKSSVGLPMAEGKDEAGSKEGGGSSMAKKPSPPPREEIKTKMVKVDQEVIDFFERNPMKPLSATYPDPTIAALVQQQIDLEKDILRQCRDNDGYVNVGT